MMRVPPTRGKYTKLSVPVSRTWSAVLCRPAQAAHLDPGGHRDQPWALDQVALGMNFPQGARIMRACAVL